MPLRTQKRSINPKEQGGPYLYLHYSAFGESLIEKNVNYGQFSSPYRFNAKELAAETGNYYYGARYYNPVWSVWLGVDPMAEKYPSMSAYVFVANNPINAIDPDGKVVIFINGLHKGEGGNRRYWGETAQIIAAQFKDFNARFYDGSSGGTRNTGLLAWSATFTFGTSLFGWNVFSANRRRDGMNMGYNQAAAIYGSLADGETIKIATHSMGGAYSKGFIKGLRKYAKEQGWEDDRIERLLDIATFQPRRQNKVNGVNHEQLSDSRDWLGTGGKIDGIGDGYFNLGEDQKGSSLEYHALPNFWKHIKNEELIQLGNPSHSPNPNGPELNVKYEECR